MYAASQELETESRKKTQQKATGMSTWTLGKKPGRKYGGQERKGLDAQHSAG